MTRPTDEELQKRIAIAKAATPGPWKFWDNRGVQCTNYLGRNAGEPLGETHQGVLINGFNKTLTPANDSQHVAASDPTTVIGDLEELLALRAEVARLQEHRCPCHMLCVLDPGHSGECEVR